MVHVAFRQHRHVKRVERHGVTPCQYEAVFRAEALYGAGREMPQMPGHVVGGPVGTVTVRVERRGIGHRHDEHAFRGKQGVEPLPQFVERLDMLHHVPQGNDIVAFRIQRLQGLFGQHVEAEVLFGKAARAIVLLHRVHLPAAAEHECRKRTRIVVTNASAFSQTLDESGLEYTMLSGAEANVYGEIDITGLVLKLAERDCRVVSFAEQEENLESYFMNLVGARKK